MGTTRIDPIFEPSPTRPGGGGVPLPVGGGSRPVRELPPAGQTEKIELLGAALDRPVVLAYGRHIVGGNVIYQQRSEIDGSEVLFTAFGEGPWDGPEVVWVNGLAIDTTNTARYHFHPGTEGELGVETTPATPNQKICSFFPSAFVPQLTFSRTAYASYQLQQEPTQPGPDFDVRGIYRTLQVRQFDNTGTQTAFVYDFNPSWVAMDLVLRRFLFRHSKVGTEPPTSVKNRLDFPAWKDWADFCAEDLTINGQIVNRFEAHTAFVDRTDLLRALEWTLLLGRAFLVERNGQIAPRIDQARSSLLTVGRGEIAAESLQLSRRALRSLPNQFVFRYRALDSGTDCGDTRQDFQAQRKEVADEAHQDQIGRTVRVEADLGNSTAERAERLAEYTKRRAFLTAEAGCNLLPDTSGVVDLEPGDVLTLPADLDYDTERECEILSIHDEVADGSRTIGAQEYDDSVFVDTAGVQQQNLDCPTPGAGIAENATRLRNVLGNGSFFRAGTAGQEGTDRPRYWLEYSNAAGSPAVPADVEHLLADDRVKLKTAASTVDKIGIRTLWKNLGRLFKPGQIVVLAVSLRHTGASGTYDKEIKLKLDSDAEDYARADSSKFDATIGANSIGNTFVIRHVTFTLRPDQQVPDALNVFVWSEATNAAKSNEDLEIDFVTLASGRLWQPYDPLDEVRDADVTWDAGTGLYDLPAHLVKEAAPSSDSGGAGGSSGGGTGSGGGDYEDGDLSPLEGGGES